MRDPEPTPDPCAQYHRNGSLRRLGGRPVLAIALAIPLAAGICGFSVSAQPTRPSQSDVQAVYLFDFAKFVRWPAGSENGPIVLCIAGESKYANSLKKIVAGERIDNRPLIVHSVQQPADATGCHILFIGEAAKDRIDGLLAVTTAHPMLTVSDVPGFLDRGGMINFLVIDNRVRFSVDLRPVERSGISLSSELLKVAVSVKDAPPGGGAP